MANHSPHAKLPHDSDSVAGQSAVEAEREMPGDAPESPRPARTLSMHLNSISLIAGKMVTMGLGFVVWLVAARLFAPAEVGLASGAVSAMMLCVQIALFGAGAAVITLFPHHQDAPSALLDSAISVVAGVALVSGGLFLLLSSRLFGELSVLAAHPGSVIAFLAMCLFGTMGVLFDQLGTVLRRGDHVLIRNVYFSVITLAILVGIPIVGGATSSLVILGAWAGGGLVSIGIGYGQLRHTLPTYRFRPRIHGMLTRELVTIGLPNWALTLTERAPGSILPIVVTEVLSPATNATWYAVWMMAWVVYVIPIQVGMTSFAEASHRPDELRRVVWQGIRLSFAVGAVAATGAAVIGPLMLSVLGTNYADEGTVPLRILVLVVVPFTFVQAYYSVCRSRRNLREAILTGALSGLAGVGVAAWGGMTAGLTGMAIAWLVTQLIAGLWAWFRLRAMLQPGRPGMTMSTSFEVDDRVRTATG